MTLHSLCICRLSLTWILQEISTSHEECWLILTGLPLLLLEPISCLPSPTLLSGFLCPTLSRVPLPTSGHVEDRGLRPLFGFAPKQTKGSSAWCTPTHSVTENRPSNLLRTARIQRRVMETWGDLLSLKLQWKLIS